MHRLNLDDLLYVALNVVDESDVGICLRNLLQSRSHFLRECVIAREMSFERSLHGGRDIWIVRTRLEFLESLRRIRIVREMPADAIQQASSPANCCTNGSVGYILANLVRGRLEKRGKQLHNTRSNETYGDRIQTVPPFAACLHSFSRDSDRRKCRVPGRAK
jgi:hypothetical protein